MSMPGIVRIKLPSFGQDGQIIVKLPSCSEVMELLFDVQIHIYLVSI